jgi:hypothetical protein
MMTPAAMALATAAVAPVHPAEHLMRHRIEGALLLGAQDSIEGLDRRGALLELRLTLGCVFGHHRRHLVEALGRGQLGEIVMTRRAGSARSGASVVRAHVMVAHVVGAHVIHVRRGQSSQQGLEGGVLVRAKLQQVMEMLGAHLHMLVHVVFGLGSPGGALFGGGRAASRRGLRQGEGRDGRKGCGGDKTDDGAGHGSHVWDFPVVELAPGCA